MAVDFSQKKSDFLKQVLTYSGRAEALSRELQELADYQTDNGLATGGANAITDADVQLTIPWGTAQMVTDAMTAYAAMKLSNANRTFVRKLSNVVIP